jgi:hypothetical protein
MSSEEPLFVHFYDDDAGDDNAGKGTSDTSGSSDTIPILAPPLAALSFSIDRTSNSTQSPTPRTCACCSH